MNSHHYVRNWWGLTIEKSWYLTPPIKIIKINFYTLASILWTWQVRFWTWQIRLWTWQVRFWTWQVRLWTWQPNLGLATWSWTGNLILDWQPDLGLATRSWTGNSILDLTTQSWTKIPLIRIYQFKFVVSIITLNYTF